jgi:hypothetical protein
MIEQNTENYHRRQQQQQRNAVKELRTACYLTPRCQCLNGQNRVHLVHHCRGIVGIFTKWTTSILLQTWRPYILCFIITPIIRKELVSELAHEKQWKSNTMYSTFRDMIYGTYIHSMRLSNTHVTIWITNVRICRSSKSFRRSKCWRDLWCLVPGRQRIGRGDLYPNQGLDTSPRIDHCPVLVELH